MLVRIGTAAALVAVLMAADAIPASAQNANAFRNPANAARKQLRPVKTQTPQQQTGASMFTPPANPMGQPMTDTMSAPYTRTVGQPFGK